MQLMDFGQICTNRGKSAAGWTGGSIFVRFQFLAYVFNPCMKNIVDVGNIFSGM
jgi:hypothetical protein